MNLGNWLRLAWDRAAAVALIAVGRRGAHRSAGWE